MITYIKKDLFNKFIELEKPLSSREYNNLGTTWEDYLDNKWVPLSKKQVEFYNNNPAATVKEVWDMELASVDEKTIEDAKMEALLRIDEYDNSSSVNDFTINNIIHAWFTPSERTNYSLSINAAKLLNQETLVFAVGDNVLQVTTEDAEKMLAAIQLYADNCFMVTKRHKLAIEALETIEEVDTYNYMVGYPEKLNFNLV